jgi:hypothetical protein
METEIYSNFSVASQTARVKAKGNAQQKEQCWRYHDI